MSEASHQLDRLEELVERLERAINSNPEFATVAEAARRLGMGVKALRGAIERGEISVYHLGTRAGGRPRVHVPEVRAWALGTAFDPLGAARQGGDAAARRRGKLLGRGRREVVEVSERDDVVAEVGAGTHQRSHDHH